MHRNHVRRKRPTTGGRRAKVSDPFVLIVSVVLVLQLLVLMTMHAWLPEHDFVPHRPSWPGLRISRLFQARRRKQFGSEKFADVRLRQIREALHALDAFSGSLGDLYKAYDNDLNTVQAISGASLVLERRVAESLMSSTVALKSCFDFGESKIKGISTPVIALNKNCKPTEVSSGHGAVVVYNPFRSPRHWCGHKIPPGEAVSLDDLQTCKDGWMNLAVYPPPSLAKPTSDDTIEVETSNWFHDSAEIRNVQCDDIPCIWRGTPYGKLKIKGTRWTFTQSAEGPQYYDDVRIDPDAYKQDRYYSSTSFRSEVPLPYFSWSEYRINSEPVRYGNAIKGASFIARNCWSKNDREALVTELTNLFRVDALSECLHNAEPPNGVTMEDKKLLMRQYLFHLAFENQCEDDYITEKLWGSLEAGVVPIYYGAPNVKEHVPPNSIIVVQDFPSNQALAKHLSEVAASKELYDKYHEWRNNGNDYPESFVKKYNFTNIHSECRTCRWAYAKKNGLGWDHETQRIVELRLPRNVCTDKMTGMAARPFKESYVIYDMTTHQYRDGQSRELVLGPTLAGREASRGRNNQNDDSCSSRGKEHSLFMFEHHEIQRSIVEHDRVIDITIAITQRHIHDGIHAAPLFMRLESILRSNGAFFTTPDHRTDVSKRKADENRKVQWQIDEDGMKCILLQDGDTRFTLWTDWETQLLSPFEGAIDVLLTGDAEALPRNEVTYRKIRVIVEDSDTLHYDENFGNPSFFAKSMAKEFYHPLEVFYRDSKY